MTKPTQEQRDKDLILVAAYRANAPYYDSAKLGAREMLNLLKEKNLLKLIK